MGKTNANEVRFSSKGQVVIPRHLRELFHIEEGTHALAEATEPGILLKPITAAGIARGYGLLKRKGKPLHKEWAEPKRDERRLEDFKASHRMSLAGAFAAALTRSLKAELVTGDPEFKALEGEIKIRRLKQAAPALIYRRRDAALRCGYGDSPVVCRRAACQRDRP